MVHSLKRDDWLGYAAVICAAIVIYLPQILPLDSLGISYDCIGLFLDYILHSVVCSLVAGSVGFAPALH